MTRSNFGVKGFGLGTRFRTPSRLAAAAGRNLLEQLEPRQMLTVSVVTPIPDVNLGGAGPATVINLTGLYNNADVTGTVVRFNTVLGAIFVELFDQAGPGRTRTTPQTVANFFNYRDADRYDNTFFHRAVANFVLQGGGFRASALPDLFEDIVDPTDPDDPVVNEPGNLNVRGTIAMAKVDGNANSATSQWFFNLANNVDLNTQNGGFTAFGRVLGNGMTVVDALAAIPNFTFSAPFDDVPLRNYSQADFNSGAPVRPDHLALISSIDDAPRFTYTATSSNTALVNPVIIGDKLVLSYGAGATGAANITFRIDSPDGSFVEDNFTVNVGGAAQTQASLAVTPVRFLGGPTQLTLRAVAGSTALPATVAFYLDLNNDGILQQTERDNALIDFATSGDNYTITVDDPLGIPFFSNVSGGQQFLIAALGSSTVLAIGATTFNEAPRGGFLSPFAPDNTAHFDVVQSLGDDLRIDLLLPRDPDGSVASVQFYRDANGNGTFESEIDVLLGEDSTPNDGFRLTVATTGFSTGIQTALFAVAVDNEGRRGAAITGTIRVNASPTVAGLNLSTANLTRGQPLTLTANSVVDTDSGDPTGTPAVPRIKRVEFYRDANSNGVFDAGTDVLLGSATTPITGTSNYSITVNGNTTRGFPAGELVFFAVPVDDDGGSGTAAQASATIPNAAPTLTGLTASPARLGNIGSTLTLTATGVSDPDGSVARVDFFRDANGNGTFDSEIDILLGSDSTAAGGYTLAVNTGNVDFGFVIGTNRYFAVVVDTDGGMSGAATITNVVNTPPTLGALTNSPNPIIRAGMFTLTAATPADSDGTIARVEFYLDINGNGTIEVGTDTLLGQDTSAGGGGYTLTRTAVGLPLNATFLARSVDNDGGFSVASSLSVTLVNSPPTITSASATPTLIVNRGNNLLLRANGVADVDGSIAGVDFFWDANNNGVFDSEDDLFLGADTNPNGGYSFDVNTGDPSIAFLNGNNRFFAVPFDNDLDRATTPRSVVVRFNAAPIIGGVTGTGAPVGRGTSTTVTATDVVDGTEAPAFSGTIAAVQFYLDLNGNGTIETSDRLLGSGTRLTGTNNFRLNFTASNIPLGEATILARARDNNGGFSDPSPLVIEIVNATPTIASLSTSPATVAFLGQSVTITAGSPKDVDGSISRVRFYLESTGDSTLDPDNDTLLGEDTSSSGGYKLTTSTLESLGFAVGANRVYAVVVDDEGATSTPATVVFNITSGNQPPTIGTVIATDAVRLGSFTITAGTVADDGTVSTVEFYLDSNQNGEFDLGVDRLLGSRAPSGGTSTFNATASGAGFVLGSNIIFARAKDNRNVFGPVTEGTVLIGNNTPTLSSLGATPTLIPSVGSTVRLTASGATDRDGTVARVDFYRDANDDGILQPDDGDGIAEPGEDILLGSDNSATGGFILDVNTGDPDFDFGPGNNTFFAVAVDNDAGVGAPRSVVRRINAAPTIGGVTVVNPLNAGQPVLRRDNVQLTATNVVDTGEPGITGTISQVQFFLDTNNNGVVDTTDRLLGTAARLTGTNDFRLTVATTNFLEGTNTVLARAKDNNNGFSDASDADVEVTNRDPVFTTTRVTPGTVPFLGQNITIAAVSPTDADGQIVRAQFYLESTGDTSLDPTQDTLLGEDNVSTGGWSLAVPTLISAGFAVGTNRVYVLLIDNDGGNLAVGQNFTITATNALPVVGAIAPSVSPVTRGNSTTLVATGLTDADGNNTVTQVEFFVDVDGDDAFTLGVDRSLGTATASGGQASKVVSTSGFASGTVTIFARAKDNRQAFGDVTSGTIEIINRTPTITSVTGTPNPIVTLGQALTLVANGAADADGGIGRVEFYFDSNNDGILQPDDGDGMIEVGEDTILGFDDSSAGGYRLVVDTDEPSFGLTTGMNRFFARVVDVDGAAASAGSVIRFNSAPTITSIDVTPNPILRSASFTVSVGGVNDDAGVNRVQIFRDGNGDGVLDSSDILVGTASRIGTSNNWLFTTSGGRLPAGTYMLFAQARDTNNVLGEAIGIEVTVI